MSFCEIVSWKLSYREAGGREASGWSCRGLSDGRENTLHTVGVHAVSAASILFGDGLGYGF